MCLVWLSCVCCGGFRWFVWLLVGGCIRVHGGQAWMEVRWCVVVVGMAEFVQDGLIPVCHVDGFRLCEQLLFPVDFFDDAFSHHVCALLLPYLHSSPEGRVVARFLWHFL